ncbi:hypothetical protein SLS62_010073 [Diatrype stigma]|uniref:Uncharacterized protein n=1 Tax=Diatrype stigma TaxID=117547 RepID=A0AAN9YJK8_9PEZI
MSNPNSPPSTTPIGDPDMQELIRQTSQTSISDGGGHLSRSRLEPQSSYDVPIPSIEDNPSRPGPVTKPTNGLEAAIEVQRHIKPTNHPSQGEISAPYPVTATQVHDFCLAYSVATEVPPHIQKMLSYLIIILIESYAKFRYVRWDITSPKFWGDIMAPKEVLSYMQNHGKSLKTHEVYVAIKAGLPMGSMMKQLADESTARTALYIQAHGKPNLVPCQQCEANWHDPFPFFGCWSIPDSKFWGGVACGCCKMLGVWCTFEDDTFAHLRTQPDSPPTIEDDDINGTTCPHTEMHIGHQRGEGKPMRLAGEPLQQLCADLAKAKKGDLGK